MDTTTKRQRERMVELQVAGRGVRSWRVLEAMRVVPREAFLPKHLRDSAYEDRPVPIAEGQTMSQPYIVALMIEALGLVGGEKVLEIGTGSGYAAAVLSRVAKSVYTVERIGQLAESAAAALNQLGYGNVRVLHGDGTLGWPDHAPYDAVVVAAGGPEVPPALKAQLKIGGRLVIPIGANRDVQELVRVTRTGETEFKQEDLADVRFVPLIGARGWHERNPQAMSAHRRDVADLENEQLAELIAGSGERFTDIAQADLDPLLERIGQARVVLIGESTHGSSEFYRMRAAITLALVQRKGFSFIAIEGDWPDAARIDHYVRHFQYPPSEWTAFARFPTWMWRNQETREFVDRLRQHNASLPTAQRVALRGLDLYSMYTSIRAVLDYLGEVDPVAARVARERYGCLMPWHPDPVNYGQAALGGCFETCEAEVVSMLAQLLHKQQAYAEHDGERFLDAVQNAHLIANAERYYRTMYYGSRSSWNLRDSHMFSTLKNLLTHHGPQSKAVVWAHNSHVGDSAATDMALRGEYNLGHLCRTEWGDLSYAIGFGTDHGQVAAASDWDAPMEVMNVRAALANSYERLCHESAVERFMLPLRQCPSPQVAQGLKQPRLERAIGVIYRPDTELQSHYFEATLPNQFDEYIWFDRTSAVTPIDAATLEGVADTYPFGI